VVGVGDEDGDGGVVQDVVADPAQLGSGPRRITELAELERLAQPTLTQLVQRLEQQGFVNRERKTTTGAWSW
jgi:predicted transcriptional regulator